MPARIRDTPPDPGRIRTNAERYVEKARRYRAALTVVVPGPPAP
ncbi:hypothetical protein [Phytohabitans houttuyneae]|nr:hypothetical protein [Phytohabitans houttuyneae]